MPKIKSTISLTALLGMSTVLGLGLNPAEAFPIGASEILSACVGPPPIAIGDKCDPYADIVRTDAVANPGLQGNIAFDPKEVPGELQGMRIQGIKRDGGNGEPLFNLDFIPPTGVGTGVTIQANSAPRSGVNDFRGFDKWSGTMKDLVQNPPMAPVDPVFPGSSVPGPIPLSPRVKDFIVINDPIGAAPWANGEVDGIVESGYALDLVELREPILIPNTIPGFGDETTIVRLNMQLQAYKIDADGKRVEEQKTIPPGRQIFANRTFGTIEFSIAQPIDDVRNALRNGQIIDFAGTYNILVGVQPDSVIISQSEVPEPSTIIGLLLLGGSTLAFSKRQQA